MQTHRRHRDRGPEEAWANGIGGPHLGCGGVGGGDSDGDGDGGEGDGDDGDSVLLLDSKECCWALQETLDWDK